MGSSSERKGSRLSCRMDAELMDWVKEYADKQGLTVTQLIEDYFWRLRRNYVNRNKSKIEQI